MKLDEYFAAPDAKAPNVLAAEVGISESTLSRIRRGLQNTTRDVIVRIVDATEGRVSVEGVVFPMGRADTLSAAEDTATKIGENIRERNDAGAEVAAPSPFSEALAPTCSPMSARSSSSPASQLCSDGEARAA